MNLLVAPKDDWFGLNWVTKDLAATLVMFVFMSHAEYCMAAFLGRAVSPVFELSCFGFRKCFAVAYFCLL